MTETRLAVQDGNLLTELCIERADRRSIVGNIYKGVVTNVLPGMQAAFVDIGLAKDAFLYAGDYTANLDAEDHAPPAEEEAADVDEPEADGEAEGDAETEPRRQAIAPIEEMLRKGQEVLVQVSKESLGTKGARVTSFVSIPDAPSCTCPSRATSASRADPRRRGAGPAPRHRQGDARAVGGSSSGRSRRKGRRSCRRHQF